MAAAVSLATVIGLLTKKQDDLVSGVNIKTVNGQTILGSGDLSTCCGPKVPDITNNQIAYASYVALNDDAINTPQQYLTDDMLTRHVLVDTSTTPPTPVVDVWINDRTQLEILTPSSPDIAARQISGLTNDELRAAPVHVIVDNLITVSPAGPATQFETIITLFSAKQDPTFVLSYTKGDILQLTEVINNATTPVTIVSSTWKNITLDLDNIAVDTVDITLLPSTSLTNSELRAAPVAVYNSDYEYEVYIANANGTGYSKNDIIRRETKVVFGATDTITETWSNVTLGTVLASVDRTHLAQGYESGTTETLNYVATQADAINGEYSADDELQRTVQWDNSVTPPASIGEKWFNVTTGILLTANPLQTHYRIYSGAPSTMENSITNMYVMTAGIIPSGAFQISVANLGYAEGTVQGSKLPPGISLDFTADAGDYLSQMTYDATGTEFIITIVQSSPVGPINPTVNAPIIISPTSGASNQENNLTLTSSPFSGFGPVGSHLTSDWEVYTEADLVTLIASSTASVANLTTFDLTGLINGEDYFARVKHSSTTGLTSPWSNLSSFNIKNVPTVIAPAITMSSEITNLSGTVITNGQTVDQIRHGIYWTRDEFAGTNNPGTAKDLVFEFATDAAFTDIVKTLTYQDDAAVLSFIEPKVEFGQTLPIADTTYKVRAKRISTSGIVSAWSTTVDVYIKPVNFVGAVSNGSGGSIRMTIGQADPGAYIKTWSNNTVIPVTTGQVVNIITQGLGNGLFEMSGVKYFKHLGGDNNTDMQIVQWGETRWTSFADSFNSHVYTASPLVPPTNQPTNPWKDSPWYFGVGTLDVPKLSRCVSFERLFYGTETSGNIRFAEWDTSAVTSMKDTFAYSFAIVATTSFNNWNTANVTNMRGMFNKCWVPLEMNLSTWNTSKVTDMAYMFNEARIWQNSGLPLFELSFPNWDVSKVTDMAYMFNGNIYNVSWKMSTMANWDVSNVTNMAYMFSGKNVEFSFSGWNTAKVTNFEGMFSDCWTTLTDTSTIPMTGIETLVGPAATNIKNIFYTASGLINFDLSAWNTSNVTTMESSFSNVALTNTTRSSISLWNTSNVTNMKSMFEWSRSSGPLSINSWNVSKVTNFSRMFSTYGQDYRMTADLSNWNTSSATNMEAMFEVWGSAAVANEGFNPGNIANWDVSNVVNMTSMFYNNEVFNADLSGWCVGSIPTKPGSFDTGTTAWVLPKPVWGTCPP